MAPVRHDIENRRKSKRLYAWVGKRLYAWVDCLRYKYERPAGAKVTM